MSYDSENRLRALAGTDEKRVLVLAERKSNARRSRRLTCPACGDTEFSTRQKEAICDGCLTELWQARDVLAGAYEGYKGKGVPVRYPSAAHNLPYPHLSLQAEVPDGAAFTFRTDTMFGRRTEGSAPRIMQRLFYRILDALAAVSPVDPEQARRRDEIEPFLPGQEGGRDAQLLRLPADALEALRHLWLFTAWASSAARQEGLDEGTNLLTRMALGQETHEGFLEEIADQTARMQAAAAKAIEGKTR